MVLAGKALLQTREIHLPPAALHDLPRHRDLDAQETVPFPILAGTGLEETRKPCHLGRIRVAEHFL
jgi:hypothetical protein